MSYQPIQYGEERLRTSRDSLRDTDHEDQDKHVAEVRTAHPRGYTPKQLRRLISVAAGTVMTLFGYEQGVFGGIIIGDRFLEYFDQPSPAVTGFVTSIYDLGCLAGALLTLVVGQKLGRRWMLLVFTVIMTAGIIIQTLAGSMQTLVWGRLIAGIGNGGNTATAPVWHVETSKAEAKGKAVAKEMTVNVMGFVLSNIFTLAFSHSATDAQWRFPLGIQLILCIIILALVWILPESPRWLLSRKREAEAKTVLAQLNDHDIEEEFRDIRDSVREEMASKVSWLQILKGGTPTRRILLGMLLQVCQQLSGINLFSYYLPLVLHESIGLPEDPARILATAIAILYMIVTGCSVLYVERLGRRKLLMWLSGTMAVACIGVAISSAIGQNGGSHLVTGIVATVFMTLYFSAFGFGWISVPWGYAAEINSLSLRTKGAALATAADWGFNYVVVVSSPPGLAALGWGLYVIYAVLNALFIPVVYYLVVETAGKSLEQMDEWFAQHPGWRVDKIPDGVATDLSGTVRRTSGGDIGEEESRGLVRTPAPFGQDSLVYDRDARSLEETDFAIGDESDLEDDI